MKSLIRIINAAVFCIATMVQLIPVKGADNNTTNEKCCGDFGCFPLGAPWSTPTRPVQPPKCPDECPVEFYMLSKKNKDRNVTISGWPIKSLKNATFDGNKITVFFVHGWTAPSKRDENNQKLGKSFLENFDVNFIFVDYSACASDPYLQAISNARTIAAQAIRFIKYLIQNHGASPSRIHVIGISLGAQIAGYIGKGMPGLWRLTGLDPAAPLFEGYGKEVELSSDDANFVEVGHTETFRFIGFGVRQPKGNVDYYFNGEVNERLLQPGCASETFNTTIQDFIKGSYKISAGIQSYLLCNHARALLYYNEAIINNNCTFWGLKLSTPINTITEITDKIFATNTTSLESCSLDTCSPWGINAIHYPATGAFFVRTNSTEPFCVDEPEVDKKMKKLLDNYEEDNKKNDKGS